MNIKPLPKSEWRAGRFGDCVQVCMHEHPPGYRYWTDFKLADLPNDVISADDLKRLGISPWAS